MRWMVVAALLAGCSEYDLNSAQDAPATPSEEGTDGTDGTVETDEPEDPSEVGGVTGRICSPSEHLYVVGADVWVELQGGEIVADITDGDGYFTLRGLPVGVHTVHVEKGSFTTTFDVSIQANQVVELAEEECLRNDIDIAVIDGMYDSIEVVLDSMDLDYDFYKGVGAVNLLRDPSQLQQYDIVFFNCGMDETWLLYQGQISSNVKTYVMDGGSIYTSDWAYFMAEAAFPNMATFVGNDSVSGDAYVGVESTYVADVTDANLRALLGRSTANITYDLGWWAVAEHVDNGTSLLRANVQYYDPTDPWGFSTITRVSPLAIRLEPGSGHVLYTSFHNERQATSDMIRILEDIILSL